MGIRRFETSQLEGVVNLSLRAWEPVFSGMKEAMPPALYEAFYPEGWKENQRKAVASICADEAVEIWTAWEEAEMLGFVALKMDLEGEMGEIYMIAVDPAHQRKGHAARLTDFATKRMKEMGIRMAMVETGEDPGHAAARACYEASGFVKWPVARYFKLL